MDELWTALLGTPGPAGDAGEAAGGELRRIGAAQSRFYTCLVPPAAQAASGRAFSLGYDTGFWFGGPPPAVPAFARAAVNLGFDRGRLDGVVARVGLRSPETA